MTEQANTEQSETLTPEVVETADVVTTESLESIAQPEPEPKPVGEVLREAREAAGLTLLTVAERFKLRTAQVEALEASDWASLPGTTFVRGMVRSYARLLNLDPEPLLEQIGGKAKTLATEAIIPASTPALPASVSAIKPPRKGKDTGLVVLGLVFLTVASLIYFLLPDGWLQPSPKTEVVAPAESAANVQTLTPNVQPLGQQEAAPTEPAKVEPEKPAVPVVVDSAQQKADAEKAAQAQLLAEGGAPIRLTFTASSWVEIKDRTGTVIFNETGKAGVEREVVGKPPMSMHIGNAGGLTLQYKGKPFDMEPFVRNNIGRVKLD